MDHTRHSGIFNVSEMDITLIGTGGIGAITAVVLAKMGIQFMTCIDDDVIEDVNLPTQFFPINNLGDNKAYAATHVAKQFSDELVTHTIAERVDTKTMPPRLTASVIISAVDSITSRKDIWQVVRKAWFEYYIDARMGAEVFQAYIVPSKDNEWYTELLETQTEDNTPDDPCTMKATIYTAALASGHLGWLIKQIATGGTIPRTFIHDINACNITTIGG